MRRFHRCRLNSLCVLVKGCEHVKAGTAESVIAFVLFHRTDPDLDSASINAIDRPGNSSLRAPGNASRIFTIVIGIGPRTIPDITYHIVIVAVLVWGLVTTSRVRQ